MVNEGRKGGEKRGRDESEHHHRDTGTFPRARGPIRGAAEGERGVKVKANGALPGQEGSLTPNARRRLNKASWIQIRGQIWPIVDWFNVF